MDKKELMGGGVLLCRDTSLEAKVEALYKELDNFLSRLYEIENDEERNKQIKRAKLYVDWLNEKTIFIKNEKEFTGKHIQELKRGNVILIKLGFNIGEELGGPRPAIVLRDSKAGHKKVLVLPITSKKPLDYTNPIYVKIGFIKGLTGGIHWANVLNVSNLSKQRIQIPPDPKMVDSGALNRISAAIKAQIALR
ncbi:type II toxin-antitoxin system PemK/MazF family toxin [Pelotomaculum isophthalicicum JI]|uniref:Type II toxin-antitoxin system PemK/MazF family toxin n=1 Tax=Pelotomaculum isophthalicicum JI TaxID=947010 RepID=A0A9X4H5K9_9FIRM|nr:type II toxin-antitoxin system PemK/MazF family toxin [Pelotomaculum isophthalicicum]MDF9409738.1 type II toxin-antitoxin system PemK/MazF family toxin [Pelotomaculum isophthalicicum JI]